MEAIRILLPISSNLKYYQTKSGSTEKIIREWRVFGILIMRYDLRVTRKDNGNGKN
jgi:hypothetical protein